MRIVVKAPCHDAFECEIPNSLNAMQSLVDGHIELVELENDVDMYVDEMGLMKGKRKNIEIPFTLGGITKRYQFRGTAIFCSHDDEDGECVSLDDEQMSCVFGLCERGEMND